ADREKRVVLEELRGDVRREGLRAVEGRQQLLGRRGNRRRALADHGAAGGGVCTGGAGAAGNRPVVSGGMSGSIGVYGRSNSVLFSISSFKRSASSSVSTM